MVRWLKYALMFASVVVLQVLVFSNIHFRGIINAFPYIYLIIMLPLNTSGRNVLLLSAFLGLVMDLACNSLGVHMAACIFAGYGRIILLPMLLQSDYDVDTVSASTYGWTWFLRYVSLILLIHHFSLFMVDSFTFVNFGMTMLTSLFSAIFSLIIICIVEVARRQ